MKVLVLDDNNDALVVIESFLQALDHKVTTFSDPQEALLWLTDLKPDVIIADLDMPVLNGFDFAKRVRCFSKFASTPILCITGTEATDEQITAGGFRAILRKPVTLSDLMDAIEAVEGCKPEFQPEPEPVPEPVLETDALVEAQIPEAPLNMEELSSAPEHSAETVANHTHE